MSDRATSYALSVVSGETMAGPHVRGACARHLRDLEHGADRGIWFDPEAAARGIGFFEDVLCLNGGQFEGLPFLLKPWQAFIVGSLLGWKRSSDNMRRFHVAYVETAKGSGKSPIAAGIGLYGLVADGEARAEIYAAATHRDQAKILYADALAMYDNSPELNSRLTASGTGHNRWNLAYTEKGSFFRVISSENKGKSGPRPHICLLDEIHEHPNRDVIEMLRAGFKFRQQPLSFMITNSGCDMTSVCREYHDLGARICAGTEENDEVFAYICALDDDDLADERYLKDETCWIKANPSLPDIPGYEYIRSQVRESEGLPGKAATVKRLNFCVWTQAETPWISQHVWSQAGEPGFDERLLEGRRCWGGLDLSSTQDLTAFALIFEPSEDDPFWRLKVFFWLPGSGLSEKEKNDKVPYVTWKTAGHLNALPGRAVDKVAVASTISAMSERYDIQSISYDRWRIKDFNMTLSHEGITMPKMIEFGQGYQSMSPAVDKFETMLLNGELRHDANPVLTWCAANTVVTQNPAGDRKPAKDISTGRIDGIVAAVMACSAIEFTSKSVYETRGFLFV